MSGTPPMDEANEAAARKGLRGWWADPPRSGMQRLIHPWEYRRLRPLGVTRVAGGFVAAGAGAVCLSYAAYGWAAFFLVVGVLNLAVGYWYITIARRATPEPEPGRGDIAAIDPPGADTRPGL